MKYLLLIVSVILLTTGMFTMGCGGSSSQTVKTTPAATTSQPAPGAATAGQLSDLGQAVYANRCSDCHGATGQGGSGGALWGTSASLGKYNTAQGLFTKISTTMPMTSPGSLSKQQYEQTVIFLLVQNKFLQPGSAVDLNNLAAIPLK